MFLCNRVYLFLFFFFIILAPSLMAEGGHGSNIINEILPEQEVDISKTDDKFRSPLSVSTELLSNKEKIDKLYNRILTGIKLNDVKNPAVFTYFQKKTLTKIFEFIKKTRTYYTMESFRKVKFCQKEVNNTLRATIHGGSHLKTYITIMACSDFSDIYNDPKTVLQAIVSSKYYYANLLQTKNKDNDESDAVWPARFIREYLDIRIKLADKLMDPDLLIKDITLLHDVVTLLTKNGFKTHNDEEQYMYKKVLIGVEKSNFLCPLSHQWMSDPVFIADGDTYQRSSIENWLKENDFSPVTKQKLEHKYLIGNKEIGKKYDDLFNNLVTELTIFNMGKEGNRPTKEDSEKIVQQAKRLLGE